LAAGAGMRRGGLAAAGFFFLPRVAAADFRGGFLATAAFPNQNEQGG